IQAPDFETRVAILQHKAEGQALELSEEVSQFIAQNVENNVRELEGALTRVHALASLSGRPISLSLAREALGAEIRQRFRAVGIDDILAVVTGHFGVKVSDLQSKRRTQSIVFPRQVAMFLARRMTQLSLEEIGGYFGGRDHTTVLYAIERVEKRRQVDGDLGSVLGELNHQVRAQIHRGRR
ncbi:MAG: helix-turn-helix domain-containing protein, partial [Planctomycetota bacterium]